MARTPPGQRGRADDAAVRGLTGDGGSNVGVQRAMRARDVSRTALVRPGEPHALESPRSAPSRDR